MTEKKEKLWHSPDEEPKYYPSEIKVIDDSVILIDEHSEHYHPTRESKEKLQKQLKNYTRWAYLSNLVRDR